MKNFLCALILLLFFQNSYAQDYVDIVKLVINNSNLGNVENNYVASVNNVNFEVYYPKKISEKSILLIGLTAENTNLSFSDNTETSNLTMTRLNVGFKKHFSEKWAGTFVVLPKIASDFDNLASNDFQIGGIALFDYVCKNSNKVKFGLYGSSENFGVILTPLIGFWHRSKNSKFYVNATLPVRMDVNYSLSKNFSLGSDFVSSNKTYSIFQSGSDFYAQEESIRFATYFCYGLADNAILLKGKVGFDTTDYEIYKSGDKSGVHILTISLAEDKRNRLNSEFKGALFVGADIIYRFDLRKN